MMKMVRCSLAKAFSRSLGDRPGYRSSSSWLVTKVTSRHRLVFRSANCHFSSSRVELMAYTMFCTVCCKNSGVRSWAVITFSQSHWST